jgi:glycosyltransferase involved in cell wall biosynthesis
MKITYSIITISYNQAKYLEQCIKSIVGQNEPVQYIIIDGGSTDESIDIIKKYEDKIAYWVSEKDQGPAQALNKGLSKATGDYVGYINSDDYLLPDALVSLTKVIKNHPGYDVYYGDGFIQDELNNRYFKVKPTKWNLGVYRAGLTIMFQQSIFINQNMFKKGLLFNEKNTTHWDGELLVDLDLLGATFYRHAVKMSVFRIHDNSISGGVLGSSGHKKLLNEIQLVNQRIDQSKRLISKSKVYWICWLFGRDLKYTLYRIFSKYIRQWFPSTGLKFF